MDAEVISKERLDFTIDLLISMTVDEIAETTGQDSSIVLPAFLASRTGRALYDPATKLWWSGPSYLADLYFEELAAEQKKNV